MYYIYILIYIYIYTFENVCVFIMVGEAHSLKSRSERLLLSIS